MFVRINLQGRNTLLLLGLTFAVFIGHRCHAGSLVGLWQTETKHLSAPGYTNKIEYVERVEFFRDQSFKVADIYVADGKRWTNVPYIGTYTILDTNRASLKFIFHDMPPGVTPPPSQTVSCSMNGNELSIPKFRAVPEYEKYRRVQ
jgi:hypothetical protein